MKKVDDENEIVAWLRVISQNVRFDQSILMIGMALIFLALAGSCSADWYGALRNNYWNSKLLDVHH